MTRFHSAILIYEPSCRRRIRLRAETRRLGLEALICTSQFQALGLLQRLGPRTLVAGLDGAPGPRLSLFLAARANVPPVEIIVLTDEIGATRDQLRAAGVVAEVLRRDTTLAQLAERLGRSRATTSAHWMEDSQ